MGVWRAQCWLGSESGYQELEVKANTWNGAKSQLERIYGAEQIINLHEVDSAFESSDGAKVNGGLILFGLAVLLLVYAWKWILLIGGISLAIWLVIKYSQE
jgi:hypothetical protein